MAEESLAPFQSTLGVRPAAIKISASALLHPSVGAYERIVQQSLASSRSAMMWIFLSALAGGVLASLDPLFAPLIWQETFNPWLLPAIPLYALGVTLAWIIFASCLQGLARLLKGSGSYTQLVCTCAVFSCPLIVVASVLSAIPWNGVLSLGLYIYWLILYTVTLQAVHKLARAKALATLLLLLLIGGGMLLGIAMVLTV
jgi:hypothetical protein